MTRQRLHIPQNFDGALAFNSRAPISVSRMQLQRRKEETAQGGGKPREAIVGRFAGVVSAREKACG